MTGGRPYFQQGNVFAVLMHMQKRVSESPVDDGTGMSSRVGQATGVLRDAVSRGCLDGTSECDERRVSREDAPLVSRAREGTQIMETVMRTDHD